MKTKPKLLIMGYGRHGKDEMANTLKKHFDFKAESSSMAAARIFIYDLLKDKYGYESFEECYRDRANNRPEWFDLITEYNRDDPSRLAREILKDNDCYVGMRNRTEVRTCDKEGVFDLIVWVDAGERVPPESSDSCEVSKEDAHMIITNNGTLSEFREKVIKFGDQLYERKHLGVKLIPRIGLDIDGVLADFNLHFLRKMKDEGVIEDAHTPATDWNDPRFRENFWRVNSDKDFWLGIPRMLDPFNIDYPVAAYITARPIATEVSERWLSENGFPDAPVITVGQDGDKVSAINELDLDVFADDGWHNFYKIEQSGAVDVNFLVDRPHNRKFQIEDWKRLYHVGELKHRLGLSKVPNEIKNLNNKTLNI